ncbi:hypothetical protein CFR76_02625 [Komagataeibacter swingsii]|uniref:Uncharacterized protein n=1 Tax=Komagataeibacter swingsii TaxID=215220 RepID=A0A2V4S6R9_9PROT|nr:hypothetical protein CFR76_02625 [Komagataeibacter swingsii]
MKTRQGGLGCVPPYQGVGTYATYSEKQTDAGGRRTGLIMIFATIVFIFMMIDPYFKIIKMSRGVELY